MSELVNIIVQYIYSTFCLVACKYVKQQCLTINLLEELHRYAHNGIDKFPCSSGKKIKSIVLDSKGLRSISMLGCFKDRPVYNADSCYIKYEFQRYYTITNSSVEIITHLKFKTHINYAKFSGGISCLYNVKVKEVPYQDQSKIIHKLRKKLKIYSSH